MNSLYFWSLSLERLALRECASERQAVEYEFNRQYLNRGQKYNRRIPTFPHIANATITSLRVNCGVVPSRYINNIGDFN
jgi:hypothetical protein